MGRPKSKPRAQRKFAQGAFIPHPQNQASSISTTLPSRAIHRAVNKPGPVTYNNCTARDMLTVMSLAKVHPHLLNLSLSPVVKLEFDPDLAVKAEATEKIDVKVKKRSKENNVGFFKKKKYELRNRSKRMRRGSVSDSAEDMPLSYLAGDLNCSPVKTRAVDGRKARRDQHVPARSISPSAVDTATPTLNDSAISDTRLPSKLSKKPTRLAKRKVASKVVNKMAKTIRTLRVARRERLRSVLKSAAELESLNKEDVIKPEFDSVIKVEDKTEPDIITELQQTAELFTKQKISAEVSIKPDSKISKEPEPEMPVNTAPNNVVATTTASCSTDSTPPSTNDSTPFKLPYKPRAKPNKYICAAHLLPGLQEMLLSTPTSVNYCNACKRCELINKYKKAFSMLPVSDPDEPDILATTPRDVYEFDSEDEGLKILRRGRELVRNVLTTKRLSFWLCNLEMTLKKTMFLDAHKLGTLKRNLQLGNGDVTVNKIISRIDYLHQCLMEDKKELEGGKTKRKTKVKKNKVAVASKPALKRAKGPDEPQLLRETKRTRKQICTSLDPDNNTEDNIQITAQNVPSSPTQGISTTLGSHAPRASTSQQDTVSLTAPIINVPIPVVSIPLLDTSLITKKQESDASSKQATIIIDLPDTDCDSSLSNDSTSSVVECLGEATSRQISEGRHLVLRLTPIELEQKRSDTVKRSPFTLEFDDPPLSDTRPSPIYDPDINILEDFFESELFKTARDSAVAALSKRKYVRSAPKPRADSNANEPNDDPVPFYTDEEMFAIYPLPDMDNTFIPVEKLTYRPTPEEFMDPINYIQKIQATASQYGICKIIPPDGFDVPCHLDDNSMFTTINQYLGRLYQRWGQTSRELTGIQTYVAQIANPRERDQFTKCPIFDGVELDLVKLYDVVLENGGIEELLAHGESWARIAEQMSLVSPRGKPDHKKLEKLYCKHVLPYESLTPYDRDQMLRKVDRVWKERYQELCRRAKSPLHYQKRMLASNVSDDDDLIMIDDCEDVRSIGKPCFDRIEECTSKGRTMSLTTYRRLAAQIRAMRFPGDSDPTTEEIEEAYWKIVSQGAEHVCVLSAYIDTAVDNLGHTANHNKPGGSHPWNLKRLGENPSNVLSYLGKTLSVTDPTLSLNQLYSTNCWHKDPHLLAWMDYMHRGTPKIWYAVSENDSGLFREAMEHLSPLAVQNKGIWLASDTTMVPPALLLAKGVKLQRIEQNPGEFIVVFPGAYASSIATGLTISESIYFESKEWVYNIDKIFQQMREDYEPGMFSNIILLFRMARDPTVCMEVLPSILKSIEGIINSEIAMREEAARSNFISTLVKTEGDRAVSWPNQEECSVCRAPLILSKTVRYNDHRLLMCLKHGVELYLGALVDDRGFPPPIIIFYTKVELLEILDSVRRRANGEDVEPFGDLFECTDGSVQVKIEEFVDDSNPANQQAD